MVAGGRDHRSHAADDPALEGAVRTVGIRRIDGSAPWGAVAAARSPGGGGAGVVSVPGEVSGVQRPALPPDHPARTRGAVILQLREEGAAGGRVDAEVSAARTSSPAP